MALIVKDRYAGEAAWTEWFEICSVAGCCAENAAKLRAEIENAMLAQLARYGFSAEDAAGDDPVTFFDGYFKLKGSRETAKPLKSYFAYRIAADGLSMLNFVCGTLFGSRSGRIHDIVLDWIVTLKGWKPRSLRGADGKRHLEWENAGPEDIAQIEIAAENDPASMVEADNYRAQAEKLLETLTVELLQEIECSTDACGRLVFHHKDMFSTGLTIRENEQYALCASGADDRIHLMMSEL